MVKAEYFDIIRKDVYLKNIYTNDAIMKSIQDANTQISLPEVTNHYGTKISFPKASEERPYIISSIALSADGKMGFTDNKEGTFVAGKNFKDPDGAALDFWVLNALRAYSDGLLLGANTLKNEPTSLYYVADKTLKEQRFSCLGKKDNPVNILVSLDGTDIPWEHISFDIDPNERLKLIIATSPKGFENIKESTSKKIKLVGEFKSKEDVDDTLLPELYSEFDEYPVIVTGTEANPDAGLMLYVLRRWGMEVLCSESPTYTAVLMKEKSLDEYFITYSMVYAGGNMTPGFFIPQSYKKHAHADLVSIAIHNSNFMYTRQKVIYGIENS